MKQYKYLEFSIIVAYFLIDWFQWQVKPLWVILYLNVKE